MITPRKRVARLRAGRYLKPGKAVVVDTETTNLDGSVVEIAIVDAATTEPLLSTLVWPGRPIHLEVTRVHGITDEMCAAATTWTEVWPNVGSLLQGRVVLAYNAPIDKARITTECRRTGLRMPRRRWACLMRLDAQFRGGRRWRPLDGGHRALGDTLAGWQVLQEIAGGHR